MAMAAVDFADPASEGQLEALAEKLRARNFEVVIVQDGAEAKAEPLKRIPEGAQVHSGKAKTLEDAGLFKELMEGDRFDSARTRTTNFDQSTHPAPPPRPRPAPAALPHPPHAPTDPPPTGP